MTYIPYEKITSIELPDEVIELSKKMELDLTRSPHRKAIVLESGITDRRISITMPAEKPILAYGQDETKYSGDQVTPMEFAAAIGNEEIFVWAMNRIDWRQRQASDFVHGVRWALAAGAHLAARKLATLGNKLYTSHRELQKMAHLLAPPRTVKSHLLSSPTSLQANRAWLSNNAGEYRGQWVALKNGSLLAAAPTAHELKNELSNLTGILVTRVY